MTMPKLTNSDCAAHSPSMSGAGHKLGAVVAMAAAISLGGCITLEAPDEPIVIELNINITQEVIYRLADDAEQTIEDNSSIF